MCLRPLGRPSSGAMSSHAGIHVLGMLLDSCAMYLLHATLSPAGMTHWPPSMPFTVARVTRHICLLPRLRRASTLTSGQP